MKYLIVLLLLAGSAWGGDFDGGLVTEGTGILRFDTVRTERVLLTNFDFDRSHPPRIRPHTYLDTVEVCDTVWYYRCFRVNFDDTTYKAEDSTPVITTKTEVITKQKKQAWLTEEEYDKLMELLEPVSFWELDTLLLHEMNINCGDSIGARIGSAE